MSSKSVARSAGLRSIRRGRQVAAVSVGSARIPPTGRPVRSGLARWFRLYQFSSFPSVSFCCLFQFVCPSRSLLVPVRLFLLARSVRLSACSRFSGSPVRSARFSFGFVRFSFRLVRFAWFPFGLVRFPFRFRFVRFFSS